jgi:hypothetical protein
MFAVVRLGCRQNCRQSTSYPAEDISGLGELVALLETKEGELVRLPTPPSSDPSADATWRVCEPQEGADDQQDAHVEYTEIMAVARVGKKEVSYLVSDSTSNPTAAEGGRPRATRSPRDGLLG